MLDPASRRFGGVHRWSGIVDGSYGQLSRVFVLSEGGVMMKQSWVKCDYFDGEFL